MVNHAAHLQADLWYIPAYHIISPLRLVNVGDISIRSPHSRRTGVRSLVDSGPCVVYGSLPPEVRQEQAALFNDPNRSWDQSVGSMGVPNNRWFIKENPILKWMRTGGTPISGNLQMTGGNGWCLGNSWLLAPYLPQPPDRRDVDICLLKYERAGTVRALSRINFVVFSQLVGAELPRGVASILVVPCKFGYRHHSKYH